MNSQSAENDPFTSFQDSSRVAISALNPNRNADTAEHIEATVVLVWPYSSSTKRLSLLLAENDVRLRKSRGQVRVTFQGECARETAKTHIGIGDVVKLGLQEVSWTETGDVVSTPGKKVNWDLDIRRRVALEIRRKNETPLFLNFRARSPSPAREVVVQLDRPFANGSTPFRNAVNDTATTIFKTPLKVTPSPYIEASLSQLIDEEDYGSGRNRKRTKYARNSGTWRFLESDSDEADDQVTTQDTRDVPSPTIQQTAQINVPDDQHNTIDLVSPTTDDSMLAMMEKTPIKRTEAHEEDRSIRSSRRESISMGPPPPVSQNTVPGQPIRILPPLLPDLAHSFSGLTPVLQPIPLPQLPLVSPLATNSGPVAGYFSAIMSPSSTEGTGQRTARFGESTEFGAVLPVSASSNADQGSLAVVEAQSSLPASVTVEERETIADEALQFQKSFTASQEAIPLESFNNSDIRGLGEAYTDLPGEYVDLDALQREIERNAGVDAMPTNTVAAIDSQNVFDPFQGSQSTTLLHATSVEQGGSYGTQLYAKQVEENETLNTENESHKSSDESEPPLLHRQTDKSNPQFDGNNTAYEAENQRIDIRSKVSHQTPVSESPEFVEISSDEDDDDAVEENQDLGEQSGNFKVATSRIENNLDTAKESTMSVNQSSTVPESRDSGQEHSDASALHMKQEVLPRISIPVVIPGIMPNEDILPSVVPPATTNTTQHATNSPADSQMSDTPALNKEPDVDLPKMPQDHEPKRIRQIADRLRRKRYSSSTFGSEYFTLWQSEPDVESQTHHVPDEPQSEGFPTKTTAQQGSRGNLSTTARDDEAIHSVPISTAGEDMSQTASLSQALSTPSSYYPKLSLINEFYNHDVDILAICTADSTEATRAKTGPKDFYTTIHLVDASYDMSSRADNMIEIAAQIFRPRKNALPICKKGNVVLLRDMKVQQQKLKPMLLSTDTSGWVVFSESSDNRLISSMTGPPVEYGEAENQRVQQLLQWWGNGDVAKYFEMNAGSQDKTSPKEVNIDPSSSSSSKAPHVRRRDEENMIALQKSDEVPSVENQAAQVGSTGLATTAEPRITRSRHRKNESASLQTASTELVPPAIRTDADSNVNRSGVDASTSPKSVKTQNQAEVQVSTVSTRPTRSSRSTRSTTNTAGTTNAVGNDAGSADTNITNATTAVPSTPGRRKKRNRKKSDSSISIQAQSPTQPHSRTQINNQVQPQDLDQVHELRDGTRYSDTKKEAQTRDQGQQSHRRQRSKSGSVVHELRDGSKYTD